MAYPGHDPKVISVFEVVASYFVDCYFNHVWHSARTNTAAGASLADEYTRRIQAFVTGTKNDQRCYSEVIQGVHTYFTNTTRFTALSFADFTDRVVGACTPADYFRQFTASEKDELLASVICDLVANLAAAATKPEMLTRIVDNHAVTPDVTVRKLQDVAVSALIVKRASLHNKFLQKIGQARDTIPAALVEDMKKALRRLVREKAEAEARASEAEDEVERLESQLRDGRRRETKLRQLVDLLRSAAAGGPAAAGVAMAAQARIPRREQIAEQVSDSSETESEDEPPARSRAAPRARSGGMGVGGGMGGVGASFFNMAPTKPVARAESTFAVRTDPSLGFRTDSSFAADAARSEPKEEAGGEMSDNFMSQLQNYDDFAE